MMALVGCVTIMLPAVFHPLLWVPSLSIKLNLSLLQTMPTHGLMIKSASVSKN